MLPDLNVTTSKPLDHYLTLSDTVGTMLKQLIGQLNCLRETLTCRIHEEPNDIDSKLLELAMQVAVNYAEMAKSLMDQWVETQRKAQTAAKGRNGTGPKNTEV